MSRVVRSGQGRVLSDEDIDLVRQLHREHLAAKARLVEIDTQLLTLMAERDVVLADMRRTDARVIAKKMGVSRSVVTYAIRPRETFGIGYR